MKAQLIRKSEGVGYVEHLHFVIAVNDKEIPLVTVTFYAGYDAQRLDGFGFELCTCSPVEVRAVFRCYQKHARLLEIFFRACQQNHSPVSADELRDLLKWGFLSELEIGEVTHALKMETDSQCRKEVEESYSQQKQIYHNFGNRQKQERSTYIYLIRDNSTNHIKIGHSKNPSYRESTLFAEKPSMELIAAWRGTKPEEKALHEEFAVKNIRGEWFSLTGDDVENIKTRFAGREQWNLS